MCVLSSFWAHQGLGHLEEFGLEILSFWTLTWLKSNEKYTGFNADLTGSKVDTYWDINLSTSKFKKKQQSCISAELRYWKYLIIEFEYQQN